MALHAVLGDADDDRVRPPRSRRSLAVKSSASRCSRRCRPSGRSRARACAPRSRRGRASPPPSRGRVKSGTGWPASIASWAPPVASARRHDRDTAPRPARRRVAAPRPAAPIPPAAMRLDDFDFDLPEELIALRPARPRPASRLLVAGPATRSPTRPSRGSATGWSRGDLLVFNDTRVIPARLAGVRRRASGAGRAIEATLIAPRRRRRSGGRWPGPASGWRSATASPSARRSPPRCAARTAPRCCSPSTAPARRSRRRSRRSARCRCRPTSPPAAAADAADREDYQTVFAARPGAVAAPTAALHFDEALLAALAARGIGQARLTLHVGAGTFLPVKVEDIARAPDARRVGRDRPRGRRGGQRATHRRRRPGDPGRHHGAAAARDRGDRRRGRIAPWRGETDIFIRPGLRASASPTG